MSWGRGLFCLSLWLSLFICPSVFLSLSPSFALSLLVVHHAADLCLEVEGFSVCRSDCLFLSVHLSFSPSIRVHSFTLSLLVVHHAADLWLSWGRRLFCLCHSVYLFFLFLCLSFPPSVLSLFLSWLCVMLQIYDYVLRWSAFLSLSLWLSLFICLTLLSFSHSLPPSFTLFRLVVFSFFCLAVMRYLVISLSHTCN